MHMPRRIRLAGLAIGGSLVIAACGGGGSDEKSSSAPPSVERNLLPATADSAVTTGLEANVVINPTPAVAAAHKLFVFLPGTDGVPDMYRFILRSGTGRGYHAIGLNYQNGPAPVGLVCATSSDPNCFWNVRREIISGQDVSNDISVTVPNAIVTRLTKALTYLSQNSADEGWAQFLVNGAVDWSKVVVAGHSQGGGHAGVLAKLFTVSRACYFSSPPDWDTVNQQPAPWETSSQASASSPAVQFGLAGLQDPSVPYSQLSVIWQSLGLAGPAVSIDGNTSFNGSHVLTTNAQPATMTGLGEPFHGVTVRDLYTPVTSSGAPVFDAAWAYLCFP